MRVAFQDAYDEIVLKGGARASATFSSWKADTRYAPEVVPFVCTFDQDYIFSVKRSEFEAIRQTIESDEREHALFGVASSDNISLTKNLNTSWAFIQLFHRYVQEKRDIPTWLEWRDWLLRDAMNLFAAPVLSRVRFKALNEEAREEIRKGLRWRLGNAYYSCLRELDVLIRLRDEHKINAKYHVLADALFRVDYWNGNKTACLFVSNNEMKAAQEGRKLRPGQFLDSPPFVHYEAVMEKQHTYGKLHLATDGTVAGIAAALR